MRNNLRKKKSDPISWTETELAEWIAEGLVPKHFLDPALHIELGNFLKDNQDSIRASERENEGKAILVPQGTWNKPYELHIVDKHTGTIIQVLDKGAKFDLCEGVVLQINLKELAKWESVSASAKKLTQEQTKDLRKIIEEFGKHRQLKRDEILNFIEELQKPRKIQKYRQSGHLIDEKLKYSKPNQELTLFDLISPDTKRKIEESKIAVKAEGIKLTPPENKIVHALNQILHEKSQNKNSKSSDFYSGNGPSEIVPYGQNQTQKAAVLKFKPTELYKAYMGKSDYSGADIAFINQTLHQLEDKKVLIRYDRTKKTRVGDKEEILTDRIEDFQSLIKILVFIPDLTEEEKAKLDSGDDSIRNAKGELVIALNPIFTDQIDTKFIEFPMDTNRRLVIAAGGPKRVTSSMMTLMEYMLRELSNKRYISQMNEENLPLMLGLEKYVKENRKKLLQERIEKDIQAMVNMGIVLKVEKQPNSTGGIKFVFHLNKDYIN